MNFTNENYNALKLTIFKFCMMLGKKLYGSLLISILKIVLYKLCAFAHWDIIIGMIAWCGLQWDAIMQSLHQLGL